MKALPFAFASGSAAQHFHARFNLPALRSQRPGLRVASIGPETTRVLSGLGVAPEVEAPTHTIEGLVEAIEQADDPAARVATRRRGVA